MRSYVRIHTHIPIHLSTHPSIHTSPSIHPSIHPFIHSFSHPSIQRYLAIAARSLDSMAAWAAADEMAYCSDTCTVKLRHRGSSAPKPQTNEMVREYGARDCVCVRFCVRVCVRMKGERRKRDGARRPFVEGGAGTRRRSCHSANSVAWGCVHRQKQINHSRELVIHARVLSCSLIMI